MTDHDQYLNEGHMERWLVGGVVTFVVVWLGGFAWIFARAILEATLIELLWVLAIVLGLTVVPYVVGYLTHRADERWWIQ